MAFEVDIDHAIVPEVKGMSKGEAGHGRFDPMGRKWKR
jgi:hypothetical protein